MKHLSILDLVTKLCNVTITDKEALLTEYKIRSHKPHNEGLTRDDIRIINSMLRRRGLL